MFKAGLRAFILVSLLALATAHAAPEKSALPDQDTEDNFYKGPDEPPPNEEMPPEETPEGQEPDYASEPAVGDEPQAVPNDSSEKQPAKKLKKAPPVATDEPLPLIRRKREPVEYNVKPPAKFIHHPNAKKGLVKISRDKTYFYKVKTSDQTKASSVHFGFISLDHLKNPETGVYFTDFYTETSNPALLYDYEWQVFRRFSKVGLKLGTGLAVATGNGQFRDPALQGGLMPKERFTFVVIPNSAGLVLRLHFWDKQIIVPYAEGGGMVFAFSELRDDSKSPKFGGALGAYGAAGAAIDISGLDAGSMLELDRDYSINRIYLVAEYRYLVGFGNFDFTTSLINGGILVEF